MAFFTQFSTINYDTSMQKRLIQVNEIAFFKQISHKMPSGGNRLATCCQSDG